MGLRHIPSTTTERTKKICSPRVRRKLSQESVVYSVQYCRKSVANVNDARSKIAALNQQEDHSGVSSTAQSKPEQQADSECCC